MYDLTLRCSFTIIQPFGKDIDGLMQVVNGHLIRRCTEATTQAADSGLVVHFAFDDFLIGTKGALEAFCQGRAFLSLDLTYESKSIG